MLSEQTLQTALEFRRARDWEQFHTPLNLAVAISVEAGELLELFQWAKPGEVRPREDQKQALRHEIADLAILLSYLAHDLGIDVDEAVRQKFELNSTRYPVEKARGRADKYDQLD